MAKKRSDVKTILISIMTIIKKEKFYSVDRLSKDLDINWKTIDNYCGTLEALDCIEVKLLGKTKVVAYKKHLENLTSK